MKKAFALILLAALVLCAFTSCDEEVALNTITLEITNPDDYLFEDGNASMELIIPSGCTKWGDLLESGESFVIKVKENSSSSDTVEMYLTQGGEDPDTILFFTCPIEYADWYGNIITHQKSIPSVTATEAIDFGTTYSLYIRLVPWN